MDLKLLLKRGALLAAANWPLVAIQFVAETTFQVLLAVPVIGAAILVASGIHADVAVAFGIAAQALLMAVGAGFLLALGAWHAQGRLQQVAVAGHLRRTRTLG